MKKILWMVGALCISAGAAAQSEHQGLNAGSPWQFFGSLGVNFGDGSDEFIKGTYANSGDSYSIKAGNGLTVAAGVSYMLTERIDAQFSVGHERTSTSGSNGDFAFTRVPLELLGFYNLGNHWRLGGGLRLATSARFESYGVAAGVGDYSFSPRTGMVLEAQYLTERNNPRGRFGVAFKLIDESFEYAPNNYVARGHHLGVSLIYYR